jgi:hypothetical protein
MNVKISSKIKANQQARSTENGNINRVRNSERATSSCLVASYTEHGTTYTALLHRIHQRLKVHVAPYYYILVYKR